MIKVTPYNETMGSEKFKEFLDEIISCATEISFSISVLLDTNFILVSLLYYVLTRSSSSSSRHCGFVDNRTNPIHPHYLFPLVTL